MRCKCYTRSKSNPIYKIGQIKAKHRNPAIIGNSGFVYFLIFHDYIALAIDPFLQCEPWWSAATHRQSAQAMGTACELTGLLEQTFPKLVKNTRKISTNTRKSDFAQISIWGYLPDFVIKFGWMGWICIDCALLSTFANCDFYIYIYIYIYVFFFLRFFIFWGK